MAETFILQVDDILYVPPMRLNQRGFTHEESIKFICIYEWTEYTVISVDEEIKKYKLQGNPCHKDLMDIEVYNYDTWRTAFLDNN